MTYPKNPFISKAKEHDVAYLKDLVVLNSRIISVFDRGYVDYQAFDQFVDKCFISRSYDSWLWKKRIENVFRFIQINDEDDKPVQFITNVMDKSV